MARKWSVFIIVLEVCYCGLFLNCQCYPMCKIQWLAVNYMSLIKQQVTSTMIWFKLCEPHGSFFLSLRHVWSLKMNNIAFLLGYSQDIFVSLRARAGWGFRRDCLLLLNIPFLSAWCQTGLRGTPSCRAPFSHGFGHILLYCAWWQSQTAPLWLFHTFLPETISDRTRQRFSPRNPLLRPRAEARDS